MTHGGARKGSGRKKKPICPRCKTRAKAKGLSYCKECKRYIQNMRNWEISGMPERKCELRGQPKKRICPKCKKREKMINSAYCKPCRMRICNEYKAKRLRGKTYSGEFSCTSTDSLNASLDRMFGK